MHVWDLSDQYGRLLILVNMSKLLEGIHVRVARETTSAIWKIEELLEIIKQEVKPRKVSQKVKINEEQIPKPPVNQHR